MLARAVKWGVNFPRRLFAVDAAGALLSAFLLGVVLVRFEEYFGIPVPVLYLLASIPVVFALYDLLCYLGARKSPGPFLIAIGIMNLLYCVLSIGLAAYHSDSITILGWSYVVVEVVIVALLGVVEVMVGNNISKQT